MTETAERDQIAVLARKIDELESREQIREVLYSYARGVDRADTEGAKEAYHPDAMDIHWDSFTGNGHEFMDHITRSVRTVHFVLHKICNPIIELDGDRAFVESRYTSIVRVDVDDAPPGNWVEHTANGRYLDIFERRDGVWRIAHRRLAKEGSRVDFVSDQPVGRRRLPESLSQPYPDDLVYRGFDIIDMAPDPIPAPESHFGWLAEAGHRVFVEGKTNARQA